MGITPLSDIESKANCLRVVCIAGGYRFLFGDLS